MSKNNFHYKKKSPFFSIILFAIISIVSLSIVFGKMRSNLTFKLTNSNKENEIPASSEEKLNSLLSLQNTDSDGDGISDYEELKVYGTSPYLKDTDGDGFTDLQEIETGEDPLCKKGQDCAEEITTPQDKGSPNSNTVNDYLDQLNNLIPNTGNTIGNTQLPVSPPQDQLSNFYQKIQSGKMSPDDIRQFLKLFGVTDEQLKNVSDEQLQKVYQEALQELNNNTNLNNNFLNK